MLARLLAGSLCNINVYNNINIFHYGNLSENQGVFTHDLRTELVAMFASNPSALNLDNVIDGIMRSDTLNNIATEGATWDHGLLWKVMGLIPKIPGTFSVKFSRQHMWIQTKQMPGKKFPGWSMKSIWYWLTGKKCLGNKNGCDEHEVTVRTFCFTQTDPGKTWEIDGGAFFQSISVQKRASCVIRDDKYMQDCRIAFCSLSQTYHNGITEDHLYSYLKTQTWRRVFSSNGEVQVRQERISGQEWHTRPSCLCCHRWRWWRDGSLECPSLVPFPLSPRMSRWVCQESRWHCFSHEKKLTAARVPSHGRKCLYVHLSQEVIAVKISEYVPQQLPELMARRSKSVSHVCVWRWDKASTVWPCLSEVHHWNLQGFRQVWVSGPHPSKAENWESGAKSAFWKHRLTWFWEYKRNSAIRMDFSILDF